MPCTTESPKYREGGFGNSDIPVEVLRHFR